MKLIYINELGKDYKGQRQYEFIFGERIDVLEDEWFIIPSSSRSVPPQVESIDLVGLLKNSDLVLELVQNSDFFGVIDAVDGIIALGWESFSTNDDDEKTRISFHYGDELDDVSRKLTERGLRLIKEEIIFKIK